MEYVYRVTDDYDGYMAGRTPMVGNPREMGRVIRSELERRRYEELRKFLSTTIGDNGGEMLVGDLLDIVKEARGAEAMGEALSLLFGMADSHELMIIEDADSQRLVVSMSKRREV